MKARLKEIEELRHNVASNVNTADKPADTTTSSQLQNSKLNEEIKDLKKTIQLLNEEKENLLQSKKEMLAENNTLKTKLAEESSEGKKDKKEKKEKHKKENDKLKKELEELKKSIKEGKLHSCQ